MRSEQILRVLMRQASREEEEHLEAWRRESAVNEGEFRQVEELWRVTAVLEMPAATAPVPDPEALIARAEAQERSTRESDGAATSAEVHRLRPRPRLGGFARQWAAAALLGALLFGVGRWSVHSRDTSIGVREITTRSGEMVALALEDGTTINVGPQSTLRLSREGSDQVAWLDGRAYFDVARDPSRTFTVHTRHGEAVVLGTQFEVRSEDLDFQVLVVEGRVRMNTAEKSLEIGEHTLASSVSGGAPQLRSLESVEEHLAWMQRTLVLHGTPLREAAYQIEQRYGIRVLLEDPRIGELTINATFTERPLEEVVLVLCAILDIECAIEESLVRIGTPTGLSGGTH